MKEPKMQIEKKKIETREELIRAFPDSSQIPDYVYKIQSVPTNIYLKKTEYESSVLNMYGQNGTNEKIEEKKGLKGVKKQKLFVILLDGTTTPFSFSNWESIGNILSESTKIKTTEEIQKIVLVTRYLWVEIKSKITRRQDLSVLVFDLVWIMKITHLKHSLYR